MQQASLALAARASESVAPTAVRAEQAVKVYGSGDTAVPRARRCRRRDAGRPLDRDHGPVGLGQVDADALPRRPRHVHVGPHHRGRRRPAPLSDKQLTLLRREQIGFVFQSFNLVPTLTALENITLPSALGGTKPDRAGSTRSSHRRSRRPAAPPPVRAVGRPAAARRGRPGAGEPARVLFADEPTGNLDSRAAPRCSASCADAVDTMGQTVVMVTHDPSAAAYADQSCSSPTAASSTRWTSRPRSGARPHEGRWAAERDDMFKSAMKGMWAHKRRLFGTLFAVVLGVAFLAGTLVLGDTMRAGIRRPVHGSERGHRRRRAQRHQGRHR